MRCGGRLKVIASLEDPQLIEKILAHRRERGEEGAPTRARRPSAAAGIAVLILLVDGFVFFSALRAVLCPTRRPELIGDADALKARRNGACVYPRGSRAQKKSRRRRYRHAAALARSRGGS